MGNEWALDLDRTVNETLEQAIEEYPDREALVTGDTRLTFRELGRQVDTLAAGLSHLGIGQGENVAVILPNCPEGFLAFFALAKIGAVAVPVNIQLGPQELQHILREVEAVAVITVADVFGRKYLPLIDQIRRGLPKLRHVIAKGGESADGSVPLETLLTTAGTHPIPPVRVKPDDPVCIFCTSGTTGLPKGAVHTHRSALAICEALLQARGRDNLEITLAPFPLFHIGGIVVLLPFFIGGKLIVMEMFDPQAALSLIQRERVTCFAAVPVLFQAILRVPDFDRYDLSSLRLVGGGGAAFPPELIRAINARFGQGRFWQGYGLTEAMWVSAATWDDPEEKQLYTIGRPSLVRAEVKIVDDERHAVPIGEVGEVACRTTGMMKGYYNRPDETAEILDREGWLYTGDLGAMDEQGYLRLVDRKRDLIKRGAEAIFPAEIERYLMAYPKVQMAAVIGVPNPIGGETICAFVQPFGGVELSAAEVINYLRGQIAPYKVPEQVRVVASLPLTATRKVQKFKLREEIMKERSHE